MAILEDLHKKQNLQANRSTVGGYVGPRKKMKKKSHKKLYFTPLPRKSWIFTKFGTIVPLADVINPDNFVCVNLFKGFDFTGGQSFHFPIGN